MERGIKNHADYIPHPPGERGGGGGWHVQNMRNKSNSYKFKLVILINTIGNNHMHNEEINTRVVNVEHGISQKPDILSLAQTIHS